MKLDIVRDASGEMVASAQTDPAAGEIQPTGVVGEEVTLESVEVRRLEILDIPALHKKLRKVSRK